MDRIDIHLDMVRVPFQKLAALDEGESSATIRARVVAARKVQEERFHRWAKPGILVNGNMGPAEVQAFCAVDEVGRNLLRAAMQLLLNGDAIEWPDLDEHIGIEGLLAGRRSGESEQSFQCWLASRR